LVFIMSSEYFEHIKKVIDNVLGKLNEWYKDKKDANTLTVKDRMMYLEVFDMLDRLKVDLYFLERYISSLKPSGSEMDVLKGIEDKIDFVNENLKTYFSSLESYLKKLSSDLEVIAGMKVSESVRSVRSSGVEKVKPEKVEKFIRPSERLGVL